MLYFNYMISNKELDIFRLAICAPPKRKIYKQESSGFPDGVRCDAIAHYEISAIMKNEVVG